jgi:hypothetical protein
MRVQHVHGKHERPLVRRQHRVRVCVLRRQREHEVEVLENRRVRARPAGSRQTRWSRYGTLQWQVSARTRPPEGQASYQVAARHVGAPECTARGSDLHVSGPRCPAGSAAGRRPPRAGSALRSRRHAEKRERERGRKQEARVGADRGERASELPLAMARPRE